MNSHLNPIHSQNKSAVDLNKNTFKNNQVTSVICRQCNGHGHYATQCPTNVPNKTGVRLVQEFVPEEYKSDKENDKELGKDTAE